MASQGALTVHLADQALAALGAAKLPMTTREVTEAIVTTRPLFSGAPTATTDIRRLLSRLERSGQIKGLRRAGRDIQWESVVVPLPTHLMPPLNVIDPKGHRP
jgi:hypothetical protein